MAGTLFLRDAKKQGFEEGFAQGALFVRDAKKQGFEEGEASGFEKGISQGIAQQKAEDEKILQESVSQISAQKDAEINRLLGEISELESDPVKNSV